MNEANATGEGGGARESGSRFVRSGAELEIQASPFLVEAGPGLVRAWAPFRPPFQPRAASPALLLRSSLRHAVGKLERSTDEILRCEYASSVTGLVDTENVLIYNLGPAHLATVGVVGVRFVRRPREAPPPPTPLNPASPIHYLEYGLGAPDSVDQIRKESVLVDWHNAVWPRASGVPNVSELWLALKTGLLSVARTLHDPRAPFGVHVEISARSARINPVIVLKPLVDAVVSAFHRQVDPDEEACAYVAKQSAGVDGQVVAALLRDDQYNLLGDRAVVGSYRGGVKWNPADERCVMAQVAVCPGDGPPTFSGCIFAV